LAGDPCYLAPRAKFLFAIAATRFMMPFGGPVQNINARNGTDCTKAGNK
jgi:hypothetical protein